MDIIITIPKSIPWEEYKKELKAVEDYSSVMNFKTQHFPKTNVGDKCYLLYNGLILGWMEITGLSEKTFQCTTTGKVWTGKFIERSGPLHKINPIPMKGFQGFRYISSFEYQNELKLESKDMTKTPIEFMSDLYNVGITKAVGYLPKDNIKIYGNDSVENVIAWCNKNNLCYRHFATYEGSTGSGGAFYVYDYIMLQNILTKYSDILNDVSIPTEPDAYIDYIEKNTVYQHLYPDAFKVIGLTFNDKRFR